MPLQKMQIDWEWVSQSVLQYSSMVYTANDYISATTE